MEQRVKAAMALAGYSFNQDASERDGGFVFENGKPGGVLRFESASEAYSWIEGYVMLSDNEALDRAFEAVMHSPAQPENSELIQTAIGLIDQYFRREFEGPGDDETFQDLSKIGIAFTTTEDDIEPIQAYCDLVNFRIYTCLGSDEIVVREDKYDSLQEMIDIALPYLDFVDLVSISDEEINELDRRLMEAFDRAMAEGTPMKVEPLRSHEIG